MLNVFPRSISWSNSVRNLALSTLRARAMWSNTAKHSRYFWAPALALAVCSMIFFALGFGVQRVVPAGEASKHMASIHVFAS